MRAQPPVPEAEAEKPEDPYGRATPRGTVVGFLRAVTRDDLPSAARYLDTRLKGEKAEELATQLASVLNRRLQVPVDQISDNPDGTLVEGESKLIERIGSVEGPAGQVSIILRRTQSAGQPHAWVFSSGTLQQIPAVYADMGGSWVERHLPPFLTQRKFLRLPLYRWIFLLISIPVAFIAASATARVVVAALRSAFQRFHQPVIGAEAFEIGNPLRILFFALFVYAQSWFSVTLLSRSFYENLAGIIAVVGFTWFGMRIVDGAFLMIQARRNVVASLALHRLMQRLTKVLVALLGVAALIHAFGQDPTTLLAGLGVGGLAIAFAAQKTIENFFGGVMIISDEPIHVGDFCQVGTVQGTVEDIGMRSTRIRTLARTMVSIPNGQLAMSNIENFAARDKFLFKHVLTLRYETTASQMDEVLVRIRTLLAEHAKVETDGCRARFLAFSPYSLDIEVWAYVFASDWAGFLATQEDLLLRIMKIVEEHSPGFAFPSQTLYVDRDAAQPFSASSES